VVLKQHYYKHIKHSLPELINSGFELKQAFRKGLMIKAK
jgi:hypothetical protein